MKKIIAALVFVIAIGFAQAQTDTSSGGTKYDYYPDANVYYNSAARTYWYLDSTTNQWQSVSQLPSWYSIDQNTKRNSFYYNGNDVWSKNAEHLKIYGKKGKAKKPGGEK